MKAGVAHEEIRDTTNPAMVSELFMGVLRGFGSAISVSAISKNTRDEVLWENALAPWRRSPMWLLIRVALQLIISRSSDGSTSLYKELMVFVMSRILKSASVHSLPPEFIYIMIAKIQRRLHKLSKSGPQILPPLVTGDIKNTLKISSKRLSKIWNLAQQTDSRDLQLRSLSTLDFETDTLVALPAFDNYIEGMRDRQRGNETARFIPASQLIKYKPSVLPDLSESLLADRFYAVVNLGQFEQWVASHLDSWVANNPQKNACKSLHDLIVQYHKIATVYYTGNPEAVSVMTLTIFELWVACDRAALGHCPWLSEYDPGIPGDVLQSLLLPFFNQMKRLLQVEGYINNRRDRSMKSTDLLFALDKGSGFANKYFDQSESHSALMSRIVSDAETARQEKLKEFTRVKAEYHRFDALYHGTDHKYTINIIDNWCDPPETEEVHYQHNCQKCSYQSRRDNLSIQVHEWPLPNNSFRAKAVVFELQMPSWFGYWSNARMVVLQDVLKGRRTKASPSTRYLLSSNDPHLTNKYFQGSQSRRIDLLSETKPVLNTHFKSKKIATLSESQVCVSNGLHYQYYDSTADEYLGKFTFQDDIPRACMYKMPCQALQRFLFRPASAPDGASPNAVIASQDACPTNIGLEEYKELATLPLGRHIQWANILVQLAMPSVDFRKPETTLVLLQCAYQAGPRSITPLDAVNRLDEPFVLRDSHTFFSYEDNAHSLLQCLTEALQRVKRNWESSQALFTFVALAARTLSLSGFPEVQRRCLTFLATAREIAMGWVTILRNKACAAVHHADRTTFIAKSVEVALICTMTFDIDLRFLESVLAEESNASSLIQLSIFVHEGEHSVTSNREPFLAILHLRRKRLLTCVYKILAQHDAEIDDAVQKSWSAFQPRLGWYVTPEAADHWVTTDTLATLEVASMSVHYNLLSGELLVNGLPLDQVPQSYHAQPLYSKLFGRMSIEIMPSGTPGFQFSTKREFEGSAVELGMGSNGELTVRATKNEVTYETISSHFFESAYPDSFVHEYVHWFNNATGTVQFRPIHEPWNASSSEMWTLSRNQTRWQLTRLNSSVISLGSLTSQRLSHVLNPFAGKTQILNFVEPSGDTATLFVSIPTLRLNFTLAKRSRSLASKEFPSMVVDVDQSLGTLVGLHSKIVLKHMTRDDRMVLVPEAEVVNYKRINAHISVAVSKTSIKKIHAVHVDTKLGRLLDNGELGCKLFLAYLHALTSFCLVDPLTHRTGTEQALTILKSAAVRSFDQLSQAELNLLSKIADLSPGRWYYPSHLRVMQTVHWDNDISFLSQHGHFVTEVKSLVQQAKQALLFHPEDQPSFPRLEKSDEHLLRRDNVRSATFKVSGFGAEDHTTHHDERYDARDHGMASQRAIDASSMSGLMCRGGIGLCHPSLVAGSLWREMRAVDIVYGPELLIDPSSLRYDAKLCKDGYHFVLQRLPALHRWLALSVISQQHKFSIIMWLSTLAFAPNANLPTLQMVAMLFKSAALNQVQGPKRVSFSPKYGNTCSTSALRNDLSRFRQPLHLCPEWNMTRRNNERRNVFIDRRNDAWQQAYDFALETCVDSLANQWPCENPHTPDIPSTYIAVNEAMEGVRVSFAKWYHNRLLGQYLTSLEQVMTSFVFEGIQGLRYSRPEPAPRPSIPGYVSEQDVFMFPAPNLPGTVYTLGYNIAETSENLVQSQRPGEPLLLESVIEDLERLTSGSRYESQYVTELRMSLHALVSRNGDRPASGQAINHTAGLSSYVLSCTERVNKIYAILEATVTAQSNSGGSQSTAPYPRLSAMFFLQQLSRHRWQHLSVGWKTCIVKYAIALTAMQRAERLLKLSKKPNQREDFLSELRNPGHLNWNAMEQPESLLMEVESGFLIRDVQVQVAAQMQSPPDGNNAVMQLNMGEGKSSVIVPVVAAALANGQQLLRVIVAKPQSKQLAQMLISKLGGLLDRRVYYMPVSRSLKLDASAVIAISDMLHDCMSAGGVLLIQPEHILSFQLMSPECYILGREDVGQQLMLTQDFLDQKARDIVDESDENFSVRFELIYTMGTQQPVELSPGRWLVLQQVLDVVRRIVPGVALDVPLSLEYHPGVPGSFPRIRILRPDAGTLLQERLADHICKNGLDGFQISRQPEQLRNAVHVYITKVELDMAEIVAVESSPFWTDTTKPVLLLLRGLVACGVLGFVLGQKRWRVNYGLAARTPPTQLAVPYRAKDSPSLRSEFSHPDVVISLTSLSYYYRGLSNEDLFITMGYLLESDQADAEYQTWIRDANELPAPFRQLQGINLKDRPTCVSEVFPPLRFSKSVIDFFLAHSVFPKEMKEFPLKLSASGWDIGKRKDQPVTGFSGTNDSRCLLPVDVNHIDHLDQRHTNALVLEYILQPENGIALMQQVVPPMSDAEHLLATVIDLAPPVQVMLDVGAQILELNNFEVAKTWLRKHDRSKEAVVFVNDNDELCVVDREDKVDLLRASPFLTRLDACLVFLDEAHTRGIDLRLPSHYRAAVTLGTGLTKDRLVQACMRMRKLGKGQTVIFCVSQEIQAKITERTAKAQSSDITVSDVILWSFTETHADICRSVPLWVVQGERYFRQKELWQKVRLHGRTLLSAEHAKKFQEVEAQSLNDRFRPRQVQSQPLHLVDTSNPGLQSIHERCRQFENLQFNASTFQEEQERELSPEIEQERQVQRAPAAEPAKHSLHDDILKFATRGVFTRHSAAYMPAFEALEDSSAASGFQVKQLAGEGGLFVSADFAKTIVPVETSAHLSDAFQRPVQWLLTSRKEGSDNINRIIIISPYEANLLYEMMKRSNAACMHIYKPLCNSGYTSLDQLNFHTISAQAGPFTVPRRLAIQLNLFSGQLYINSYEDYGEICSFLGLLTVALTKEMSEEGWRVAADGFVLSDNCGRIGGGSGLHESPVCFLKVLMSKIRRNGNSIAKTHIGQLLEGKIFHMSEFKE